MRRATSANDPTATHPSSTSAPEGAQPGGTAFLMHTVAKSEARAWTMSRLKLLYDYAAREPLPTTITALVERAGRN